MEQSAGTSYHRYGALTATLCQCICCSDVSWQPLRQLVMLEQHTGSHLMRYTPETSRPALVVGKAAGQIGQQMGRWMLTATFCHCAGVCIPTSLQAARCMSAFKRAAVYGNIRISTSCTPLCREAMGYIHNMLDPCNTLWSLLTTRTQNPQIWCNRLPVAVLNPAI